jgi:hypothetical protein
MQIAGWFALLFTFTFVAPQERGTQNIESLYGTVAEVAFSQATPQSEKLVEIRLKTADKKLRVLLAPAAFLDEFGFNPRPGDEVYIRAYRVTEGAAETLVAIEIGKENRKLEMRTERGRPLW